MKLILRILTAAAVLTFMNVLRVDLTGKDEIGESQLVLDINSSVVIAISNSFDLKEIRAGEELYALTVVEKLRNYFPSLSFSFMRLDEVNRRESDERSSRISVESEVTVYDGGRRSLDYDTAKLNAILSRNDYRIALNRLVSAVREEYLNLIRLNETAEIYKITLEQGRLQHKFIKREFELGDATKLAVLEIEARIMEIDLLHKQSIEEYETAMNRFKLLLRINRHAPVIINGNIDRDFTITSAQNINEEELVSIALKMRKEVESGRARYEISEREKMMNERYFVPNVSVGFNCSLSGEDYPPREKGWGFNIKFSSGIAGNSVSGGTGYDESGNGFGRSRSSNGRVNVLDDMNYKSSLVQSRIDLLRAENDLSIIKEKIALDISSSCSGLVNAWEMICIASKQVQLYESQLVIEKMKADMGESRRFDILEKEIERSKAAVALLNAKIKYLVSASSLEISMGTSAGFIENYIRSKNERSSR